MKEFWDTKNGVNYFLERRFAWLPEYINGTLGWLRFYWLQTGEKDGEIQRGYMNAYWHDPREEE